MKILLPKTKPSTASIQEQKHLRNVAAITGMTAALHGQTKTTSSCIMTVTRAGKDMLEVRTYQDGSVTTTRRVI